MLIEQELSRAIDFLSNLAVKSLDQKLESGAIDALFGFEKILNKLDFKEGDTGIISYLIDSLNEIVQKSIEDHFLHPAEIGISILEILARKCLKLGFVYEASFAVKALANIIKKSIEKRLDFIPSRAIYSLKEIKLDSIDYKYDTLGSEIDAILNEYSESGV